MADKKAKSTLVLNKLSPLILLHFISLDGVGVGENFMRQFP